MKEHPTKKSTIEKVIEQQLATLNTLTGGLAALVLTVVELREQVAVLTARVCELEAAPHA